MRAPNVLLVLLALASAGCTDPESSAPARAALPPLPSQAEIAEIGAPPPSHPADEALAGAFALLDGEWVGEFEIYVDTLGQQPGRPLDLATLDFAEPRFELQSKLDVHQRYVSETPYFQRVTITDTYADGTVVEATGANKVQAGRLWCVVNKPDDQVIHLGELPRPDTIIWSRDRAQPLSKERFRETVAADTYSIVGWGYYGEEDTSLSPRLYFRAVYRRP